MPVDSQNFKQALAKWGSGVTVITTRTADGTLKGMTASSFSSVSLEPPLILTCIAKKLYTHQLLTETGFFAVNLLSIDQIDWGKRFAGMYPDIKDRFADINYTTAVTGAPILPDVLSWVDCTVHACYDAGDHSIFVGEVVAAATTDSDNPLMYFNRQWGTFKGE